MFEYTARVTTMGILNDIHGMNPRWSDNRAGLIKFHLTLYFNVLNIKL